MHLFQKRFWFSGLVFVAGLMWFNIADAQQVPTSNTIASFTMFLDEVVSTDAAAWRYNRYVPKTVRNIRIVRNEQGQISSVVGIYTYTSFGGSRPGWIEVRIDRGQIQCIRYHDFPNQCRAIGDTARYSPPPSDTSATDQALINQCERAQRQGGTYGFCDQYRVPRR